MNLLLKIICNHSDILRMNSNYGSYEPYENLQSPEVRGGEFNDHWSG